MNIRTAHCQGPHKNTKTIILYSYFCCDSPHHNSSNSSTNMVAQNDLDIIKPVNDIKQYRHCKLPNGLDVLLIHDPRIADAPSITSDEDEDAMSTEEVGQPSGLEDDI